MHLGCGGTRNCVSFVWVNEAERGDATGGLMLAEEVLRGGREVDERRGRNGGPNEIAQNFWCLVITS